jgi:hypothetical protein
MASSFLGRQLLLASSRKGDLETTFRIQQIISLIQSVKGTSLLQVDPGHVLSVLLSPAGKAVWLPTLVVSSWCSCVGAIVGAATTADGARYSGCRYIPGSSDGEYVGISGSHRKKPF